MLFASSYFAHDYYALPLTLFVAIAAGFGLEFLFQNVPSLEQEASLLGSPLVKKFLRLSLKNIFELWSLICLASFGFVMNRSAQTSQAHYLRAALVIQEQTQAADFLCFVSSLSLSSLSFYSEPTAWIFDPVNLDSPLRRALFKKRLQDHD